MKKCIKAAGIAIIIGLIVLSYVQYRKNIELKNNLGSMYLSNIQICLKQLNNIEQYLANEKDFNDIDLSTYNDEMNYITLLKIPSNNYISQYMYFIKSGIQRINGLVAKNAGKDEIEECRKNTLELVSTLKSALEKMDKSGYVKRGNSYYNNNYIYYNLSLSKDKTMDLINADLEKNLKKQYEYINMINSK